jgi:hypothetical protein
MGYQTIICELYKYFEELCSNLIALSAELYNWLFFRDNPHPNLPLANTETNTTPKQYLPFFTS